MWNDEVVHGGGDWVYGLVYLLGMCLHTTFLFCPWYLSQHCLYISWQALCWPQCAPFCWLFWDRVLCISSWPQMYYVAQDDLELLILLPSLPLISWITGMCSHARFSGVLGIEHRVSCTICQHFLNEPHLLSRSELSIVKSRELFFFFPFLRIKSQAKPLRVWVSTP